jgi:flagellar biosynthesis GTPase FlhF
MIHHQTYVLFNTNKMADLTPTNSEDTSSTNSPLLTDRVKVQQWLSQNYLSYSFADARPGLFHFSVQNFTDVSDLFKWFDGDIMSLAIALSTDSHNRQDDVFVIATNSTQTLYNLGLGRADIDDIRTLPSLYQGILDISKRWIVVPCSDGLLLSDQLMEGYKAQKEKKDKEAASREPNTTETNTKTASTRLKKGTKAPKRATKRFTKAQKAKEEAKKKKEAEEEERKKMGAEKQQAENEKKSAAHEGHGSHWGLLIVDKQQKIAHWVDSLVTLSPNGKISSMFQSAIVGGKVLCGIDAILATQDGHEKGEFNASTLKYVPHQMRDNDCHDDMGACGPFAFAFLQHLYNNPSKMESLKASFPRSRLRSLRFNSLHEREEVQRLMQRAANDDKKDALPFCLTLDLLHILRFLTGGNVSEMAQSFGTSSRPSRRDPRAGKRPSNDGNDDDDDSDGDWGPGGDDVPIPKDHLRLALDSIESAVLEGLSKDDRYRLAYSTLKQAQEDLDKKGKDSGETPEAKKARETEEALREAERAKETKDREPEKANEMREREVRKAKEAKDREAQKAREAKEREAKKVEAAAAAAYHAMRQEAGPPPKPRHPPKIQFPNKLTSLPEDFTDRNALPLPKLQKWWAANQHLLTQMGIEHQSAAISIRAALQVLAGVDFDDETDARLETLWLNDPYVFNAEMREASTGYPGIIAGRMKGQYNIDNVIVPPVSAPPDTAPPVIDWTTAPTTVVFKELKRAELMKHKSVNSRKKVSGVTARAILYVRDGGTFAGESNSFLDKQATEIWVRDANVFTRGEDYEPQEGGNPPKLLNGLRATQIRARMKAQYEPGDVMDVTGDNDEVVAISSDSDSSLSDPPSDEENDSSPNGDSNPSPGDGGNPQPDLGSNPQPGEGNNTDSSNTSNPPPTNPNKRKRSSDHTQTSAPAAKHIKLSPPSFLTLDEAQLKIWVNKLKPHPIVDRFTRYEPTRTFTWQEYDYEWREDEPLEKANPLREDECRVEHAPQVRLVLERVFNRTFQNMQKEDPLSKESLELLHRWYMLLSQGLLYNDRSEEGLKRFLDRSLMSKRGAYSNLPDWSKGTEYWPEYWTRKFVVVDEKGAGQ